MSNSKSNSKAVAVACAVLLTCVTAQLFAGTNITNNASVVYAETASMSSSEVKNNDSGTQTLIIYVNTGDSTSIDLTLSGLAGYTTSGGVGYWDNSAQQWVDNVYEWSDQTFDSDGNLTISGITVPANTSNVQIMVYYYASWASGSKVVGNMSDIKVVDVTDSSSTTTTTTTASTATTSTSSGISVTNIEINDDGIIVIHVNTGDSTSVTLTLSGSSGYTTSGEVGYWDSSASEWVGGYSEWSDETFDSDGNLTISGIKVPANTNDVQIMITYYASWASGSEVLGDMNEIEVVSVTDGSSSTTTTTTTTTTNGGSTLSSNAECGWTDITSGTENTQTKNLISESVSGDIKTVTISESRQWSAYDEGNEPLILDQTYEVPTDENGNELYDTDSDNETITNSNNFNFTDAFNLPSTAEINHFRFTVESDDPMYQVQLGAGISVQADCEMANSGGSDGTLVWFNESGTAPEEEGGEDYATITNSNGKSYYGLNTTYESGTNYIQAQWDVYDDVKPYISNTSWSSVSLQYWYGVDPADWALIDWENSTGDETVDPKPEQIYATEASVNYNITESYSYTDTVSATVGTTISVGSDMEGISFADLGLGEGDKPKAVTFTVSATGDIGKLIGAFGVSVNDEYTGTDLESANWYQGDNIVYEDCGSTYEITWIIPSSISNYVSPEYDAEIKFGCWYAGYGETTLSSLTIKSVSVDYYSEPEVTTTTTNATTTVATTTTTDTTTTTSYNSDITTTTTDTTTTTSYNSDILWGDANCDGLVNGLDLVLLKQYILGIGDISEQGLINSDVTHDGSVKGTDLVKLKQFILGLIEESDLATA